jgi:hypothetical protein
MPFHVKPVLPAKSIRLLDGILATVPKEPLPKLLGWTKIKHT